MRSLAVAFFAALATLNALAQCPIHPLQASYDAKSEAFIIRYSNSDRRVARDVLFVVTSEAKRQSGMSVIGNFSARGIVRPKQERTAVFPNAKRMALNDSLELEVSRVSFVDLSIWAGPTDNICKIAVTAR
jgi:hypothetical protein